MSRRASPALPGLRTALRFCAVAGAVCAVLLPVLNAYRAAHADSRGLNPRQYVKNPHAVQHVRAGTDTYAFEYAFKDQNEAPWIWSWSYNRTATDAAIDQFGVPPFIYEPYRPTERELERRRRVIHAGLFRQNGDYVEPDYNAMVGHYMDFAEPLHGLLEQTAGSLRSDKLETLLKFVQDIPYGIPPDRLKDRVIAGVLPPPHMFVERWGDCDSKAVLFASVLAHDPSMRLVFLLVPNHILLAVEGIPRPYQHAVEVKGRTYILAEPVGPGRVDLGDTGAYRYDRFNDVIEVRPTRLRARDAAPVVAAAPRASRDDGRSRTLAAQAAPAPISAAPSAPAAPAAGVGGGRGVFIERSNVEGNMLSMTLRADPGTTLMGSLERSGQKIPGKVMIRNLDASRHELLALFDRSGDYRVTVFAKPKGPSMEFPFALDHRLSHTFELSNTVRIGAVFPDLYTEFGERDGFLETPLVAPLQPGSTTRFRLRLTGAQEAGVLAGDALTPLTHDGDFWEGEVNLPLEMGAQVVVVARAAGSDEYLGLLSYALGG